ncbi:hypothetical protein EK904_008878 [Melospiza melodia maxima]|nr:hypothetical protein EK904_008878 [Melospiza melodia maxima]
MPDQRGAKTVSNPCWPLSYSQEVQWQSVHAGPCGASGDTQDIPGPKEVFNITGSSNPTACINLVQSLLNSSSSCSFFSSGLKPLHSRLLVVSEAMDFLRGTAPSADLGQAVQRLCGMSVQEKQSPLIFLPLKSQLLLVTPGPHKRKSHKYLLQYFKE